MTIKVDNNSLGSAAANNPFVNLEIHVSDIGLTRKFTYSFEGSTSCVKWVSTWATEEGGGGGVIVLWIYGCIR